MIEPVGCIIYFQITMKHQDDNIIIHTQIHISLYVYMCVYIVCTLIHACIHTDVCLHGEMDIQ